MFSIERNKNKDKLLIAMMGDQYVYYDKTNKEGDHIFSFDNKKFIPFYFMNENYDRNIHYIFGKSGVGKSTLAQKLSFYFNKIMDVVIISPIKTGDYKGSFYDINSLVNFNKNQSYEEQNKIYNELKIKFKYFIKKNKMNKNEIDMDLLKNIELDLLKQKPDKANEEKLFETTKLYNDIIKKPSLFIYDDNEIESNYKKLMYLMNTQLLTGRHQNINMIILNHQSNNGLQTRNIINESNLYTFFNYNRYVNYFLKNYLLLDEKQINICKNLLKYSRFVTIYKDLNIILTDILIFKI